MKVCDNCGNYLDENDKKCPVCGTKNKNSASPSGTKNKVPKSSKSSNSEPRTISELAKYCMLHGFTSKKTRFFIGIDYREPKAFGIYRDVNGNFVVYKNKADGTRTVRYEGPDEGFAVHELYARLQEEIVNQKQHAAMRKSRVNPRRKAARMDKDQKKRVARITLMIISLITTLVIVFVGNTTQEGYYNFYGQTYYYLNRWYLYNDYLYIEGEWYPESDPPLELIDNSREYYLSDTYDPPYGVSDFRETSYYSNHKNSKHSSDGNTYYGNDSDSSWDSGATDWDSDW